MKGVKIIGIEFILIVSKFAEKYIFNNNFYILSFIEMTEYIHTDRGNQNEPKVCVSVCPDVCKHF